MRDRDIDERLSSLPDFAVLTQPEAEAITSLSRDTLNRLHRERLGPPRVRLSERRFGYPAGGLREWLKARSS